MSDLCKHDIEQVWYDPITEKIHCGVMISVLDKCQNEIGVIFQEDDGFLNYSSVEHWEYIGDL